MSFIQEMGIKDLEHVVLKAKDYMTLGNMSFEPGEPVLYFENIQIAMLSENTQTVAARGGFLNQPRVVWEDRSDTTFQFSNGTLNQLSMNLLLEANVVHAETIYVPYKEYITLDEQGRAYLAHLPDKNKKRFYKIFDAENLQERIIPIIENGKKIQFDEQYAEKDIIADYYYTFPENDNQAAPIIYTMDRERKANLYSLEATFYLKDENEGLLHTGILEMPKVYIMSNINLRMGERADPTVGTFRIVAMPENKDSYEAMVCKITYLDEDIYGI